MSKLSLDALKERAAGTDQQELLNNISGGTYGDCHDGPNPYKNPVIAPFKGLSDLIKEVLR